MQSIMKATVKTALLFSVCSVLFACGQKNVTPEPVTPAEEPAQTRTLTFILPDGMSWTEGDQIVVHGEYAKDQVTVTLAASDIAAGGQSATKTVEGLRPYKREDCTSTLYASFPARAVDNLKHCFFDGLMNPRAIFTVIALPCLTLPRNVLKNHYALFHRRM